MFTNFDLFDCSMLRLEPPYAVKRVSSGGAGVTAAHASSPGSAAASRSRHHLHTKFVSNRGLRSSSPRITIKTNLPSHRCPPNCRRKWWVILQWSPLCGPYHNVCRQLTHSDAVPAKNKLHNTNTNTNNNTNNNNNVDPAAGGAQAASGGGDGGAQAAQGRDAGQAPVAHAAAGAQGGGRADAVAGLGRAARAGGGAAQGQARAGQEPEGESQRQRHDDGGRRRGVRALSQAARDRAQVEGHEVRGHPRVLRRPGAGQARQERCNAAVDCCRAGLATLNAATCAGAGISLSPEQWEKLYSFSDAIADAIQLVEEDNVGMESLAGVPGCILRPDGDVRAIALPVRCFNLSGASTAGVC
ncbi:unnamed protein product [Phytophthora fragariaefolia]|uniref:Unnamed protein product n=1 Tax=Phytophthora fragariaefolia TaxID=1490495 RepID=A0A9W6XNF5_9STRA|nr:unnamed protein product [Phytophthora fragariaefolia]